MSVELNGIEEVLAEIQRKLGPVRLRQISDEALKSASLVFKEVLIQELSKFSGKPGTTGATINEVKLSEPTFVAGVRMITVYWSGPKNRYRIIHLNEFGTVNNPNPEGKGAIQRALLNAATAYKKAIWDSVERSV